MSEVQQSEEMSVAQHREIAPAEPPQRIDMLLPTGLVLRTPRLLLRALRPADRESFIAAARAGREQLDLHIPMYRESEGDDEMFKRQLELAGHAAGAQHSSAPFLRLVAIVSDGRIAGGFNINAITRGLEWSADINWWITAPLAGRGLATEGVGAILRHALAELPEGLGLHAVNAWITRDNPASIRVAEKAGLKRAGAENSYISTGGRWVLHDRYTA